MAELLHLDGLSGISAVRRAIARKLLESEVGQRLPSMQAIQDELGVSAGTVVKAFKELQHSRAVTTRSRGHKGTTMEDRDVGRLWAAASIGSFALMMPPPGPLEQGACLQAVRMTLDRLGVLSRIEYASGAATRLAEVYHQRANAAMMSAGAFGSLAAEFPGMVGLDLGSGSYYGRGTLVVVRRRADGVTGRPRVAIDHHSVDHVALTEAEFGHLGPQFVECPFVEVPALVLAGTADLGVWHRMPTVIPPEPAGLDLTPLGRPESLALLEGGSHGVLVTRAVDAPTNALLRELRATDVAKRYREMTDAVRATRTHPLVWPR